MQSCCWTADLCGDHADDGREGCACPAVAECGTVQEQHPSVQTRHRGIYTYMQGHRFMLLEAVQAIQSADLAEAAVGFLPDDCSELTAAALRAAARVAAAAVHMTGPRDNSNAGGKGQWGGRYTEAADATACNGGYRLGAFGSPERGRPSSAPVGGRGRSCSPRVSRHPAGVSNSLISDSLWRQTCVAILALT